jgi:hypothetical protein
MNESATKSRFDTLHPHLSSEEAPFWATLAWAPKFEIVFARIFDVNCAYDTVKVRGRRFGEPDSHFRLVNAEKST